LLHYSTTTTTLCESFIVAPLCIDLATNHQHAVIISSVEILEEAFTTPSGTPAVEYSDNIHANRSYMGYLSYRILCQMPGFVCIHMSISCWARAHRPLPPQNTP
ncbi:unnamed protein product, partial [Ectocarpus sp. 12 AP-2014]